MNDTFDEREEFDADDGGDYAPVQPPRRPAQVYSVRIPVDRLEELRRVADDRGVGPSTLMREWVLQRLDAESGVGTPTLAASYEGLMAVYEWTNTSTVDVEQVLKAIRTRAAA